MDINWGSVGRRWRKKACMIHTVPEYRDKNWFSGIFRRLRYFLIDTLKKGDDVGEKNALRTRGYRHEFPNSYKIYRNASASPMGGELGS
jgi:hypothetical protein